MAIAPRLRWTIYGVAAIATFAAIRAGDRAPSAEPDVVRPTARSPANAPRVAVGSRQVTAAATDLLAQRRGLSPASTSDPFADDQDRPVAAAAAAAAVSRPAPPAAPSMPALPYTYIGRWQENGRTVVYLQENGESVVQVHGPGQLNDRYTVESVADDRLVLKDKPTGTRQTLLFARAATAGGTGAAPTGAEAAASGGSQEEN